MPLGIVSDEEFEAELQNSGSKSKTPSAPIIGVPSSSIQDIPTKGRNVGDNNVPESLRKIIGEEAVINGRPAALEIANHFGISASSVSAYAKGATSTTSYNSPKKSILDHITKSRSRAVKRASHTLNQALGSITQDKLDYSDAKELAGIAKDMSAIIKNLEPPSDQVNQSTTNSPQFVIFAPQFRKEETFDVIQVNE